MAGPAPGPTAVPAAGPLEMSGQVSVTVATSACSQAARTQEEPPTTDVHDNPFHKETEMKDSTHMLGAEMPQDLRRQIVRGQARADDRKWIAEIAATQHMKHPFSQKNGGTTPAL